jgi:hypothetical protein
MNDLTAGGDPALDALLDHIGRERDRECAEIMQNAEAAARDLLRNARHASGQRVRHALAQMRREIEAHGIAARAAAETALLRRRQQRERDALERAWPLLRDALVARWADAAARRTWLRASLRLAAERLLSPNWTISHPPTWSPHDAGELLSCDCPGIAARWQSDEALSAGLRIAADGATVDASLDGLLAPRARIEGRLLAELDVAPGNSGS